MRWYGTLFLVLVLPAGLRADSQGTVAPIRVYVAGGGTDDGGLRDSAADLTKVLESRVPFRRVDAPAAADIQVRVIERFRRRTGRSLILATSPNSVTVLPIRERVVRASLTVGDETLELKGAAPRSWRAAARDLADSLEAWVRAHDAQLR